MCQPFKDCLPARHVFSSIQNRAGLLAFRAALLRAEGERWLVDKSTGNNLPRHAAKKLVQVR